MRPRRALATVTLALAALAAPASAKAPPKFTELADQPTGRVVAGNRYAGYATATAVRVIDTKSGIARDVAPPREGCSFVDVGGGQVLWECPAGPRESGGVLTDLHTGEARSLPNPAPSSVSSQGVTGVGAHWVSGWASGYHFYGTPYYQRWREDERSMVGWNGPRDASKFNPDLDYRALMRPLCRPLRRPRDPSYEGEYELSGSEYLDYQYERPFGLYVQLVHGKWRVTLQRCGTRKKTHFASDYRVHLRAGLITWTAGDKIRGYLPKSGRRLSWRLADIDPRAMSAEATHTATTVLVTTTDSAGTRRLYAARWRAQPAS